MWMSGGNRSGSSSVPTRTNLTLDVLSSGGVVVLDDEVEDLNHFVEVRAYERHGLDRQVVDGLVTKDKIRANILVAAQVDFGGALNPLWAALPDTLKISTDDVPALRQLHSAIAAMHDEPSRPWTVDDLAEISAMSRGRFIVSFREVVGITPAAYLTTWRLTVGRRLLQRGERVKRAATLVGFGSAAAFSRAYARAFRHAPREHGLYAGS